MIARRVEKIRRKVQIDTQKIRRDLLQSLKEIFKLASSLARGEFKTQTVDGEKVKVTLNQRQAWARVAAYTAQTINVIADGFDERQIDIQLDELERLINEAEARAEAQRSKKKAKKARGNRSP